MPSDIRSVSEHVYIHSAPELRLFILQLCLVRDKHTRGISFHCWVWKMNYRSLGVGVGVGVFMGSLHLLWSLPSLLKKHHHHHLFSYSGQNTKSSLALLPVGWGNLCML